MRHPTMGTTSPRTLGLVLACALLATAACSDSTAPKGSPIIVDRPELTAAVLDARLRLVPVIENQGVRDRIAYDMQEIQAALAKGDDQSARYHVRIAGGILIDYRNGLANVVKDGPDVGGIALALYAVAARTGGTFDISAFH